MVLTRGRTAYFGPARESVAYMERQGFPFPKLSNPADHLLSIVNPDFAESTTSVDRAIECWQQSPEAARLQQTVSASTKTGPTRRGAGRQGPGFLSSVWTLTRRSLKNYSKNPMIYVGRFFTYVVMSIFLGTLNVKMDFTQNEVFQRVSLVQWTIAFFSYMAVGSAPLFSLERGKCSAAGKAKRIISSVVHLTTILNGSSFQHFLLLSQRRW